MAFVSTNPVAVGDYGLKSQYDAVFANTRFLHDDVLKLDGDGGVVLGKTSPLYVADIYRDVSNDRIEIVGGPNPANDARLFLFGSTESGAYSGYIVLRTGNDPFTIAANGGANIMSFTPAALIDSTGLLRRDVNTESLEVRGGPDGNDARIIVYGQNAASAHSLFFRSRADNSPFSFIRNDDQFCVKLDPSTGEYTFYRPSSNDEKILLKPDADPAISLYINGSVKSIWGVSGDDATFQAAGNIGFVSDNDGSGHQWTFRLDGALSLPSTSGPASYIEGTIWYESTAAAGQRLRVMIDGVEKYINVTA